MRFKPSAFFLLLPLLSISPATILAQNSNPSELLTVAEESQFKATSSSEEVVDFIDRCASRSSWITSFEFGRTVEGRPMLGVITGPDSDVAKRSERVRILLLGNIHSGECAGKEALLRMLREMTLNPEHPWLDSATIVFVPNYNADGNDRVGRNEFHRPGQLGPENGMGTRENAQQLDLNRDFIKLTSPEAKALVNLIDRFDPHLSIDCHTTNGSRHQYQLTYDVPHNLSSPEPVRNFLRNRMMPAVTQSLADEGKHTFYYGNLSRDRTRWTTYGHEPRYSTEYVGMRGRLAVLSEAYSYIPYRDRIDISHDFVTACVNYVLDHSKDVMSLLDQTQREFEEMAATTPHKIQMHLAARSIPFAEKVTIRGYEGDSPTDFEVEFVGDFEATRSVPLPYAYVIGNDLSRPVDRLKRHGIAIHRMTEPAELEVTTYQIQSVRRANRRFQGHEMVTVETRTENSTVNLTAGSYVILTSQPLGRLASYMLEPGSDDGLVTWNFFDTELTEGGSFPVYRIEQPRQLPLQIVDIISPKTKLTVDMLAGNTRVNFAGSQAELPTWIKGQNQYMSTWDSRPVSVDAKSGGMSPIRPRWSSNDLLQALIDLRFTHEEASAFATSSNQSTLAQTDRFLVVEHNQRSVVYDIENKTAVELSTDLEPAELFDFSPNGEDLAFVRGGNLFVYRSATKTVDPLTDEDGSTILSGKLDWVYQEELYGRGNFKGFWWSPDGQRIAFLQLDTSNTPDYTVVDDAQVDVIVEISSYPLAGQPQAIPRIVICEIETGKLTEGNLGEHHSAEDNIVISNVAWDPDSTALTAQIQNRQQTFLDLMRLSSKDGSSNKVFRDQTPAWIESPGAPVWIGDHAFLWMSPRSGTNQIYRYSADGTEVTQLTQMEYGIQSIIGFHPDSQTIFFEAKPDGIRGHVFALELTTQTSRKLTEGSGHHAAKFSADFSYFFDIHSTASETQRVDLRDGNGRFVRSVHPHVDDRMEFLEIQKPRFEKIFLGSGEEQYETDVMLILPPDFDASKKYPVLYHVYAGPQAPTVRDQFRGGWYLWHQMLAQHGYVVFMCDNRSAGHYGPDRAWPVHRNLGELELHDIELAANWLQRQPWVDGDRIGIWGWSYGGYITAYAMTRSNSFKCGIAGAPVTDWRNYDSIYTERYMGLPDENPEGYERSSVVTKAADLHGKLLLIHGTIDDNVHIGNTMQLVYALQNAGKNFDLMVYPKNRHGITREPQVKHLRELMTRFILENL